MFFLRAALVLDSDGIGWSWSDIGLNTQKFDVGGSKYDGDKRRFKHKRVDDVYEDNIDTQRIQLAIDLYLAFYYCLRSVLKPYSIT